MPVTDETATTIPLQVKIPPPVRPAVPVNKETLARAEVSEIEAQALVAGWERDQMDELTHILKVFMPCKVGIVRREAIGILLLDTDGEIRGSNNFYNMRTEQPWLKKVDVPLIG